MVKNVGDLGLIPRSGRSPEEGNGSTHQYSCLENSTDRGAWWATVHGVATSRTQLSNQLPTLSTCHVPSSFIYSYHPYNIQWHSFWEAIESLCNWTTWFEYYEPCHLQAVWLWAKYLTALCLSSLSLSLFFFFWPRRTACWILVPWPDQRSSNRARTLALKALSLNHWPAREFPVFSFV